MEGYVDTMIRNLTKRAAVVLTALAVLCLPAVAHAADSSLFTFEQDGENLMIGAKFLEGREVCTVFVVCPSADVSTEYDVVYDLSDKVVAADMVSADENGELSYMIPIGSKGPFGTYTAFVGHSGKVEQYKTKFTRSSPEILEQLRTELNSSPNKLEILIKYSDITLIDKEWYENADEKMLSFMEGIIAEMVPVNDVELFLSSINGLFEKIYAVSDLNKSGSVQEFAQALNEGKQQLGVIFEPLEENNQVYVKKLYDSLPLSSWELIEETNEEFLLCMINSAAYGSYRELIMNYPQIGISDYEKKIEMLTKTQEEDMLRAVAEDGPFKTLEEFCSSFELRCKNALNNKQHNLPSASHGGGGGSSSLSGGRVLSAPLDTETNGEPQKEMFSDLHSVPWATEAITYLAKLNAISGKANGVFDPADNVKREEFVKMVLNSFAYTVHSGTCNYSDVEHGSWYENYIYTAFDEEIIFGYDDVTFGIGQNLSRQDAAVILLRAITKKGGSLPYTDNEIYPNDFEKISDYAAVSVSEMFNVGILTGDENRNFNPEDSLTRAEAAKMIYECLMHTDIGGER